MKSINTLYKLKAPKSGCTREVLAAQAVRMTWCRLEQQFCPLSKIKAGTATRKMRNSPLEVSPDGITEIHCVWQKTFPTG